MDISIIYIIVLVIIVITLIIFYVLYNKYKMVNQIRVLDSLIDKLKVVINVYYQDYLKIINKYHTLIDDKLYEELDTKLGNYNKIENINDMIEEYIIIDKLIKKVRVILENNHNINKKLTKTYNRVNKVIQEYNRNVLIMNKYLYKFSSIFIAKFYKFKGYPYFRSSE